MIALLVGMGVAFMLSILGTPLLIRVLERRGFARVVATDQDPRALACARANIERLRLNAKVEVVEAAEAEVAETAELGSHTLFVCEVREAEASIEAPALARVRGRFEAV